MEMPSRLARGRESGGAQDDLFSADGYIKKMEIVSFEANLVGYPLRLEVGFEVFDRKLCGDRSEIVPVAGIRSEAGDSEATRGSRARGRAEGFAAGFGMVVLERGAALRRAGAQQSANEEGGGKVQEGGSMASLC
jgi:hypothetical protein